MHDDVADEAARRRSRNNLCCPNCMLRACCAELPRPTTDDQSNVQLLPAVKPADEKMNFRRLASIETELVAKRAFGAS